MNTAWNKRLFGVLIITLMSLAGRGIAQDSSYDPLAVPNPRAAKSLERTVQDRIRDREIPLRIYLPDLKAPAPVVLYSHGLGGSRESNPYLGEHWSARGYVVVVVQHPGSDEAVWKDLLPRQRLAALKRAANLQNAILRFRDIPAVIDQLEGWNQSDPALAGQLDLKRIGMSGHSFGAVTTQAVSGERMRSGDARFTDKRIVAALAMSPSAPQYGDDLRQIFGGIVIPWMLMTGTNDVAAAGDADVLSRLAVYPALPLGGKYELVLDGAEHEAFSDRILPANQRQRNPSHHRAILALSTAFWDTWLREDAKAKEWLDGEGPSAVLDKRDRWQRK